MRREVRTVIEELQAWLPSEPEEFQEFIARALASLPGGERLEELGVEPLGFLGWKEMDLIASLFSAIRDADDVRAIVDALYFEEE